MTLPPKPPTRPGRVPLWRYLRLFRQDILSAQPARLFGAWMAEFRTPFFRSYLVNEPKLWRTVLTERPGDFPKSDRVGEGLRPLLGRSVFVTNGATWARQRRIIDPAFAGGRLRDTYPAMLDAARAATGRLTPGRHEVEAITAHAAADVIFRTLFSLPIDDRQAMRVFTAFRAYQRCQPIVNLGAFLPLPRWMPRAHPKAATKAAGDIRTLLRAMTDRRAAEIADGTAPDDLATKIMTTPDPETGETFEPGEMADQVAIFFLAGHETSASVLAWALYLLATHPDAQETVANEAVVFAKNPTFSNLSQLAFTRDVFREALRLYPPVPMMVREATKTETFRKRTIRRGAQIVISPWHLHRHTRLWDDPDAFDPARWQSDAGRASARDAYLPFSTGPRVCPGAGFAMAEGVLMLAMILAKWRIAPVEGAIPRPVAHLTLRAKDGIPLDFTPRTPGKDATSEPAKSAQTCPLAESPS
ncbi:MAG: cytochrome P450 [Alphaproteobacteria bacterium]|nr:cytochrome P450 [Alphaproteobacteria bacterium]